jgi:hypothetical protein
MSEYSTFPDKGDKMFAAVCSIGYCRWLVEKALALFLLIALLLMVGYQSLPRIAEAATGGTADHLLISEVFYDTTVSSDEWIEIYNPTSSDIDLSSYKVGDEETAGGGEGMFQFPAGTELKAGNKIVIASKATSFFDLYGEKPSFEFSETDPDVENMVKYSTWATGSMNLGNAGDEVLILNESDVAVDAVVYESGLFSGVVPHPGVAAGHSIERSPAGVDTDDCSLDFIDQDQPNPETGSVVQPPAPPGGDTEGSATKTLPVKANVVHTLYIGTCEPWLDGSNPMPANWCDEHPKNEVDLGTVSPAFSEGTDSFQICVRSNNEWTQSVSWTDLDGAADGSAAGEVIPADRMRVELNDQEINNNYVSALNQQLESSQQIDCSFKPDWSDPVGKYVGSITVSVTQN